MLEEVEETQETLEAVGGSVLVQAGGRQARLAVFFSQKDQPGRGD